MNKIYSDNWMDSVYSDGTDAFISNPTPNLNEEVEIKIRMLEDSPVEQVFLRYTPNGSQHVIELEKDQIDNGLIYYRCKLKINEPVIPYRFYIKTKDKLYVYNQLGLQFQELENTFDFVLLANYDQPKWVKESVFYQIFPERFFNGNPKNDVVDNEYIVEGNGTIQYKDWNDVPLEYPEAHCLDFYGGDLEGITKKIPYFKDLGINALYLNPIFEAPSSHKYDCIDYFTVDKHFGGDEALEELSKQCHENGIRLILDISINHTGANHIWFNRDGIFYDKSKGAFNNPLSEERNYYFFDKDSNNYKGWFDLPEMPTLNYTSEELRNIIYKDDKSVLKKWLKEPFNIDGWRFDVADVFARNDAIQLSHEVWPEIRKNIKDLNKEAYILAEDWDDCVAHLRGDEWDSAMNYYGCARILREYVGAPELFLERTPQLANFKQEISAKDVVNKISRFLARLPYVIAENQFNLIDSHDVSRLHNYDINPGDYRGAVLLQFLLVGAPSIYYGDEIGIDGNTTTVEGCRYPMPWSKDFNNIDIFTYYKKLIHLKTSLPALKKGGMKFLAPTEDTIILSRFYKKNIVVGITTKSNEETEVFIPIKLIGGNIPISNKDLLDQNFEITSITNEGFSIKLTPHSYYLIDCSLN